MEWFYLAVLCLVGFVLGLALRWVGVALAAVFFLIAMVAAPDSGYEGAAELVLIYYGPPLLAALIGAALRISDYPPDEEG